MPRSSSAARFASDREREAAASRYRANLARHLIGIARDLQARVLGRLSVELGYEGLRPSLGPFLSLVWTEPRPLTLLAEQLAISKQACSQLARVAEHAGYLMRSRDGEAGRAALVHLSPHGRALVRDAIQVLEESEAFYRERVGPERFRRFTTASAALFAGLGIQSRTDPTLDAAARRSIGVLPLVAVHIEEELMEATRARGHEGLRMSHGQVLALIGHEGARTSQMARVHGVSRQAISATVRDLETLGYVGRESGLRDGRGVLVRLTDRGEKLIRDSILALDGLESTFRGILGSRRLADLEEIARDLYDALRLEEEVFGPHPVMALQGDSAPRDACDSSTPRDLDTLAASLLQRLGPQDAARLGSLLISGPSAVSKQLPKAEK